MLAILMVIQVFVAVALIGVVLIQRSEGGGLGIGNSQGMGAFMSGRGTANLLTRTTAILAAVFLGLSLAMAMMNRGASREGSGILAGPPAAPAPATQAPPAAPVPTAPAGTAPAASGPASTTPAAPAPATTTAPAATAPAAPAPTPAPAAQEPKSPPAPSAPQVPH